MHSKFVILWELQKKKHKLVGMYYMLGNLPYEIRSKTDNIQLLLICKERNIKEFGINKILEEAVKDLKVLENDGLNINLKFNFKGSVFIFSADNLGAHQVYGLCENFSTTFNLCRFCYFTIDDLKKKDIDCKIYRTKQSYDGDLCNLAESNQLHERGLKNGSILNELKHFHVAEPGLPPCLAHDLFECVIAKDLYLILKKLFDSEIISKKSFIASFSDIQLKLKIYISIYIDDKNKRIKGRAYDLWQCLPIVPLCFLQKNFDFNMPAWIMLIRLLEITRIICSHRISICEVNELRFLLNEYMDLRHCHFPDEKLTPKYHYLMHYPDLISKFGPLIHFWTLQFEHKHQYFINAIRNLKNFKNVEKMLANLHQTYQASLTNNRCLKNIVAENFVPLVDGMFQIDIPCMFKFVCKQIIIKTIKYQENDGVIISLDDPSEIKVIQIKSLFLDDHFRNVGIYGQVINFWYNSSIGVFQSFEYTNNLQLILMQNISHTHYPVKIYSNRNVKYVSVASGITG